MALGRDKTYIISLKQDGKYLVNNKVCHFRKVTAKGYMFIIEETGKQLLTRLVYPMKDSMKFMMFVWVVIKEIEDEDNLTDEEGTWELSLKVGTNYSVNGLPCLFTKVSPIAYNFVIKDKNITLYNKNLYPKNLDDMIFLIPKNTTVIELSGSSESIVKIKLVHNLRFTLRERFKLLFGKEYVLSSELELINGELIERKSEVCIKSKNQNKQYVIKKIKKCRESEDIVV